MMTVCMSHLLAGVFSGWLLTRLAIFWAQRWGYLDYPDRQRKLQDQAVPLGGGVAVFLATLVTVSLGAVTQQIFELPGHYSFQETWGLLLAAAMLLVLGLMDDRYNIRARYKLLGQIAAVLALMFLSDHRITSVSLFGWVIELGILSAPLTVFWLLACINALNLIDGMDGLLGTVGSIALGSFGLLAVLSGHTTAAVIAFSMMGAVLGFLWWNLPPARIYLGDAGSMLMGLVVGTLALQTSLKGPATVALGAPLAILVLPIFDTTAAILRRKLTGRGLAAADRGHIHHVLLRQGFSPSRVLLLAAAIGMMTAAGALASMALQNDFYAVICMLSVITTLIAGKWFGYAEWKLLQQRVAATARNWTSWLSAVHHPGEQEFSVHLQGSVDWNLLWHELLATIRHLPVVAVHFDVTIPSLHEDYHARWSRGDTAAIPTHSCVTVPLWIGGVLAGQLHFILDRSRQPLREVLYSLCEIVESVERQASAILPIAEADVPAPAPCESTPSAFPASSRMGALDLSPATASS